MFEEPGEPAYDQNRNDNEHDKTEQNFCEQRHGYLTSFAKCLVRDDGDQNVASSQE
jgi:hypothetical protein